MLAYNSHYSQKKTWFQRKLDYIVYVMPSTKYFNLLNDTPPNLIAIFELTPLTIIWNAPRSYIIGLCCHMYNISIVYTEHSCVVAFTKEQSHIFSKRRTTVFVYVRCTDKCVMCVIHTVCAWAHWVFDVLTSLPIVVAHWLHWLHTSRSHFDDNDKYDDAMMVALGGRLSNKNTGF